MNGRDVTSVSAPGGRYDEFLAQLRIDIRKADPTAPITPEERHLGFAMARANAQRASEHRSTFMGVKTLQNPLDAWITQEIIFETRPHFIVECGTRFGGSAALWATFLGQLGGAGRVLSIDIESTLAPGVLDIPAVRERVDYLKGSSTDPAIVQTVHDRVAGAPTLVILDSDHRCAHVLAELRAYTPLVQAGSYCIVQDTIAPEGPGDAIAAFLAECADFEIDQSRERYVWTNNVGGYLRRVREPRDAHGR